MENNDVKIPIGKDLLGSIIGAGIGHVFGRIGSWINPLGVPKAIKEIHEGGIKDLSDFTYAASGAIGYGIGYYNIVNGIVNEPSDVISYIPVVLNVAVLDSVKPAGDGLTVITEN